jgi:hypothetical protein
MQNCPVDYYNKYIAIFGRKPPFCLAPDQKPKPVLGPMPPIQVNPPTDVPYAPPITPIPVQIVPYPPGVYPHRGYGRRLPPRRQPPRRHAFHNRFKPRPVRGPMPPIRVEPTPVPVKPVATGPACPSWGWYTVPVVVNGVPSERVIACQPGQPTGGGLSGLEGLFDVVTEGWTVDGKDLLKEMLKSFASAAAALGAVYILGKHRK